jgi:ankyrin repeat protein
MDERIDTLREAIETGDLTTVKRIGETEPKLLQQPLLPRAWRSDHPMTEAAVSGHADILAYLIAKGGDVMQDHNFPLCRAAVRGGCVQTMQLLVQHGADVNRVTQDYGPPLIFAIEGSALDSMEFLLENGAQIAGSGPSETQTVSWDALKHATSFNQKCPGMLDLLIEHGADVNSPVVDQHGGDDYYTALHGAAEKGDIKGVKLLLRHGADPTSKNGRGQQPIEVTKNKKVRELLAKS